MRRSCVRPTAARPGRRSTRRRAPSRRPGRCRSPPARRVTRRSTATNESRTNVRRYVAKTTDNGRTWQELALAHDHAQREFGVGFASDDVGWVGAMKGGFVPLDGGRTWRAVETGRAVNEIRLLPAPAAAGKPAAWGGYAIGVDVFKLGTRP